MYVYVSIMVQKCFCSLVLNFTRISSIGAAALNNIMIRAFLNVIESTCYLCVLSGSSIQPKHAPAKLLSTSGIKHNNYTVHLNVAEGRCANVHTELLVAQGFIQG